jgi:hypothetical protein
VHDDYFKRDELDDVWLESCGGRNWVVFTPDKNIQKDPVSMRAIGESKGRVFFLSQNNKSPDTWAPIIISCWSEIYRAVCTRPRPFIANVSPNGVWRIKELNRYGREKKQKKRDKPKALSHSA